MNPLGSENGLQFWSPKLPLDGTTQALEPTWSLPEFVSGLRPEMIL
jgi:hypothetical protein